MAFIAACLVLGLLHFALAFQVGNIPTVIIPGTGDQSCPTAEQLNSARKHLSDEAQLVLDSSCLYSVAQCGNGVWCRLVSINMSDPLGQYPGEWAEENVGGVRACGRGTIGGSCRSVLLGSNGSQYTRICGRAIGYQYGHTDAFARYRNYFISINQT